MERSALIVVHASLALTACHPPDRAIYEESKDCVGVFDVAMKQIPRGELRKAGLYSDDVQRAANDDVDAALKFGANAGLNKKTILIALDDARNNAWQKYGPSGHAPRSGRLIEAAKRCMPNLMDRTTEVTSGS